MQDYKSEICESHSMLLLWSIVLYGAVSMTKTYAPVYMYAPICQIIFFLILDISRHCVYTDAFDDETMENFCIHLCKKQGRQGSYFSVAIYQTRTHHFTLQQHNLI